VNQSSGASFACDAYFTMGKAHLQASRGQNLQANPDLERLTFSKLDCSKNAKRDELLPLRHFADERASDTRNLERLQRAWFLIVGPGHSHITRPISIRHGLLLVGCHDASVLKSMRLSAQDTWPNLRERINAMLKTRLQRIDIVPCDPEPARTERKPSLTTENIDPLDAVLRRYCRARVV